MGGGNNNEPTITVQPSVLQNRTIPAFMPGQQGALAAQLAGAYGSGGPQGVLAANTYLNNMYRPMTVPLVQNSADIAALRKKFGIADLPKPKGE